MTFNPNELSREWQLILAAFKSSTKEHTDKTLDELTKEFNTPVMNIVKTQWINSNCSDIIFINQTPLSVVANGNIQVNNYILGPGAYVGFMGNNAEINRDTYNVVFDSAATSCVIIKKLYTKK